MSDTTSRHPREDEIQERYAVNAFDAAVRAVVPCRCSQHPSDPCEHVRGYNIARQNLLSDFLALNNRIVGYRKLLSEGQRND